MAPAPPVFQTFSLDFIYGGIPHCVHVHPSFIDQRFRAKLVHLATKGSLNFEDPCRINQMDIRFSDFARNYPALPISERNPEMFGKYTEFPVVSTSQDHITVILWWPGYKKEAHVTLSIVPYETIGSLWVRLHDAVVQWWDLMQDSVPQDSRFKIQENVPFHRVAVCGLEHISGCWYQIKWYHLKSYESDFVPPYKIDQAVLVEDPVFPEPGTNDLDSLFFPHDG